MTESAVEFHTAPKKHTDPTLNSWPGWPGFEPKVWLKVCFWKQNSKKRQKYTCSSQRVLHFKATEVGSLVKQGFSKYHKSGWIRLYDWTQLEWPALVWISTRLGFIQVDMHWVCLFGVARRPLLLVQHKQNALNYTNRNKWGWRRYLGTRGSCQVLTPVCVWRKYTWPCWVVLCSETEINLIRI